MANRKQFLSDSAIDPELSELLENARKMPVTEDQLSEQRVSFAYGNAPDSDFITKETVRKSSNSILLTS